MVSINVCVCNAMISTETIFGKNISPDQTLDMVFVYDQKIFCTWTYWLLLTQLFFCNHYLLDRQRCESLLHIQHFLWFCKDYFIHYAIRRYSTFPIQVSSSVFPQIICSVRLCSSAVTIIQMQKIGRVILQKA